MSALILAADDDPFNLRLLQELCDTAGHRVQTAESGDEVLEAVSRRRPDLILLDLDMPGKTGFEVMEILRDDEQLNTIPIIVVTAMGDVDARNRGIELGADDYVTKPYRVFEIQQRVRNVLRLRAAENRAREATEREARLRRSSMPPLGLGTSQQFLLSLDYEFTRAERYSHPLSLLVIELLPKEVQKQGLSLADTARFEPLLQPLADALRGCIRGIDHLFRSDALEFSILLPETDREGAATVEQRIQEALGQVLDASSMAGSMTPHLAGAYQPDDGSESGEGLRQRVLSRLRESRR